MPSSLDLSLPLGRTASETHGHAEPWSLDEVQRLLACLPLKKGLRFLDAACGEGAAFFPVFERLKGEGVFIAAEYREEMLRRFFGALEAYASHPRFTRIEVARFRPFILPLPDSSVDLALFAGAFHRSERRPACLAELKRVLSPGGTPAVLKTNRNPQWLRQVQRAQSATERLRQLGYEITAGRSGAPE
ncbi:MAG: methyltransferase domain-containing protein, partial [candidate division FCPU426 bacterium]